MESTPVSSKSALNSQYQCFRVPFLLVVGFSGFFVCLFLNLGNTAGLIRNWLITTGKYLWQLIIFPSEEQCLISIRINLSIIRPWDLLNLCPRSEGLCLWASSAVCSRNSLTSCHPWAFLWTCHINWALESLRIRHVFLSLIKLVCFLFESPPLFFFFLNTKTVGTITPWWNTADTCSVVDPALHSQKLFWPLQTLSWSFSDFLPGSGDLCRITNLFTWKVWPALLSLIVLCQG